MHAPLPAVRVKASAGVPRGPTRCRPRDDDAREDVHDSTLSPVMARRRRGGEEGVRSRREVGEAVVLSSGGCGRNLDRRGGGARRGVSRSAASGTSGRSSRTPEVPTQLEAAADATVVVGAVQLLPPCATLRRGNVSVTTAPISVPRGGHRGEDPWCRDGRRVAAASASTSGSGPGSVEATARLRASAGTGGRREGGCRPGAAEVPGAVRRPR